MASRRGQLAQVIRQRTRIPMGQDNRVVFTILCGTEYLCEGVPAEVAQGSPAVGG